MRTIVLYPGRFQPFCPHHARAYMHLVSIFGVENVFIVTSNTTDNFKSPLNFQEKLPFIRVYVPETHIIEAKQLYKVTDILKDVDLSQLKVIFAHSSKDLGRIEYMTHNGPGFLQPWIPIPNMKPATEAAYVYILPEYKIRYKSIQCFSGTAMRELFKKMAKSPSEYINEFKSIFKFYIKNHYELILKKFK